MKFIRVFGVLILAFQAFESMAMMGGNGKKKADCHLAQNTTSVQLEGMSYIQKALCKQLMAAGQSCDQIVNASRYEDESRRAVPGDPRNEVAQVANKVGSIAGGGKSCGGGGGGLIKWGSKTFVLASAHQFFDLGTRKLKPGCTSAKLAKLGFFPNAHYKGVYGEDVWKKRYSISLNSESVRNFQRTGNDFVLLEISGNPQDDRVTPDGPRRGAFRLVSSLVTEDMPGAFEANGSLFIAKPKNFTGGRKSYEKDCDVASFDGSKNLLRSTCDTGKRSSGNPYLLQSLSGEYLVAGVHSFSANQGQDFSATDWRNGDGNAFVPSQLVVSFLRKNYPGDSPQGERYSFLLPNEDNA